MCLFNCISICPLHICTTLSSWIWLGAFSTPFYTRLLDVEQLFKNMRKNYRQNLGAKGIRDYLRCAQKKKGHSNNNQSEPRKLWKGHNFLNILPKFNSSPLKSYRNPIGKDRLPFPPFFMGDLLNFGGVIFLVNKKVEGKGVFQSYERKFWK